MVREKLSHIGKRGRPRMVDVGGKKTAARAATAVGRLRAGKATLAALEIGYGPKGSVGAVAAVAAIQAAKRCSEIVPLCHLLPLDSVAVDFDVDHELGEIVCTATARARARTGVEIEALTAVHVGLLVMHDMCKSVDRDMEVTSIRVTGKTGGKHDFGKVGDD